MTFDSEQSRPLGGPCKGAVLNRNSQGCSLALPSAPSAGWRGQARRCGLKRQLLVMSHEHRLSESCRCRVGTSACVPLKSCALPSCVPRPKSRPRVDAASESAHASDSVRAPVHIALGRGAPRTVPPTSRVNLLSLENQTLRSFLRN